MTSAAAPATDRKRRYAEALGQMTLRSVHELFEADHDGAAGHTHVVLANGTRVARLAVDGCSTGPLYRHAKTAGYLIPSSAR